MTLAENIGLALKQYTSLSDAEIRDVAAYKLMLVGLAGFEDYYPNEISGGMKKRAGLARAMALDPEILFFDEPSAGLDPISAKLLDDLILELQDATIVDHQGAQRARATATLVYQPADSVTRAIRSRRYTFNAPLGPIELEEIRWYLEDYSLWPVGVFAERAARTRTRIP